MDEHEFFVTDRSLSEYERRLGIDIRDFNRKKILDIGSGERERFSREASKYGAEVYSVNPALVKPSVADRATQDYEDLPPYQGKSVAGIGESLPFQDNSFDSVVAMYVYMHVDKDKREDFLNEAIRVMSSESFFYLYPLQKSDVDFVSSVLAQNVNVDQFWLDHVVGPAEEMLLQFETEDMKKRIIESSPLRLIVRKI